MTRYVILILLALVVVACGSSPTPTIDQAATRDGVDEATSATNTMKAPTATFKSTDTNTPVPTSTLTRTVVRSSTPIPSSTPMPESTPTLIIATHTRSQDGMVMVEVPAGDFTMGSPAGEGGDDEVPQHTVTLDGFWIDRTEVTNAQYRLFVDAVGYQAPTKCDWGDPTYEDATMANHPVVCVSWEDAQVYCEWVGAKLPTEAQWEKAARGTDRRTYPWGSSFDGSRGNYCDINCEGDHKDTGSDDGYARTAPVGSYPTGVSPYGALDMAGNVWEWVSDPYNFYYYSRSPQYNPQGPASSQYRVLRGGSWYGFFTNERVTFRASITPEQHNAVIGFRCVMPLTISP